MVNNNRRAEQRGVEGGRAPRGESMENWTQAVFVGCNQQDLARHLQHGLWRRQVNECVCWGIKLAERSRTARFPKDIQLICFANHSLRHVCISDWFPTFKWATGVISLGCRFQHLELWDGKRIHVEPMLMVINQCTNTKSYGSRTSSNPVVQEITKLTCPCLVIDWLIVASQQQRPWKHYHREFL